MQKLKKQNRKNQIFLNIFLILLAFLFIYPFLLLLSVSFSKESDIINYGYSLIPKNFSVDAYKYLLRNAEQLIQAYKVTIFFSVTATFFGVLLQAMIAYPLSRKTMKGRQALSFFLYFTMLFGGGMVSEYIVYTQLYGLSNNILVYILPALINPWNNFMIRTFFQGLPDELFEAVKIDGGNPYIAFFKFALPLSKPVIATVAFTTFLGMWNDWYTSLLYINNDNLISLQYLLQRILQNIDLIKEMSTGRYSSMVSVKDIPAETVRMAMTIVVAGPTLVIFPFFQKYFVKGLTVGSVKG